MSDAEFLIKLLKSQTCPLNLNEICACIPKIPRDNVKELLEFLVSKQLIITDGGGGPMFPRVFEAK